MENETTQILKEIKTTLTEIQTNQITIQTHLEELHKAEKQRKILSIIKAISMFIFLFLIPFFIIQQMMKNIGNIINPSEGNIETLLKEFQNK